MITSKDNDLIKLCNELKHKKFSKKLSKCLVETSKIVSELYLRGLITNILVTEANYSKFREYKNCKIDVISDNIANSLTDTVTTDGVFGICNIPNLDNVDYSKCLILDRLQDPSNIGAIIRSACAFGYTTIFAIDSVYPYSYKSIRSSMGYIFDMQYIDTTLEELSQIKVQHNIQFICADMSGEIVNDFSKDSPNVAIIIGNEGRGVSRELRTLSDRMVRIPMENNVESLNASVSAGIIMYMIK